MNNGYNYRTLNPWEQIALEHLSAIIGEIIGAGFDNPENLTERISDLVIELTCWNISDCDEEIMEIFDINPATSGEDGDKKINPAWEPTSEEYQKQDLSLERESENIPH
ncbi:hypothetical protein MC7420_4397 [Coleofasciculus chthonoplastes PCC 7420]|uniref:Uncharacterized protein n=1 Tax=Coleofasciculus chthonoplastes PCC 7420 TaxID=118168 RepID=B4VY49_9CYAN|nr:hypothetical protein [Coleofasciculus chthonoplastes]EDX73150.1 hypothetical protein MC7420_4397 [Coleofasciculus chthonoplastes PCC 7420]